MNGKLMRNFVANVLMVVVSVFVSLLLIETYLHFYPFPTDQGKPDSCKSIDPRSLELYKYSLINYSYPRNADLPLCGKDYFVTNKSDDDGYLGTSTAKTKHSILVFGDSFAYGFGVKKEEAFASLIGSYNAGLWGNTFQNHAQVLNRLLQKKRNYETAFWVIYPSHIITASTGSWNSRIQIDKDKHPIFFEAIKKYNETALSKAILAGLGIGMNTVDYYTSEWSLYDETDAYTDSGYEVLEKAAREINRAARENNIKIIPIIIPSKRQLALKADGVRPLFIPPWRKLDADLPTRKIDKILQRNGFSIDNHVVILDEMLTGSNRMENWRQLYFINDAHFNRAGNSYVANVLCGKRNLRGILSCD